MRELMRSIAKANMKDYGIHHMNKKKRVERSDGSYDKTSFFASYWRKWVGGVPGRNSQENLIFSTTMYGMVTK